MPGAEHADQHDQDRDGRGSGAGVVRDRVGDHVAVAEHARAGSRPPKVASDRTERGGHDRHEQRLGPDQPPRLARGGADGAQQADLDLALA